VTVYQYGQDGIFVGPHDCQSSPLEPGVFLIPPRCSTVAPPETDEDHGAFWESDKWVIKKLPEKMTTAERIEAGIDELPEGCIVDTQSGNVRAMTILELYQDGKISREEAIEKQTELVMTMRKQAYLWESDPIRHSIDFDAYKTGIGPNYAPWYAAVEAVKARLPKPGPEFD